MSQTLAIWFFVLVTFCVANLPFVSQRVMLVLPPSKPKTLAFRLLELVVFYFLSGSLAWFMENRMGQVAPQTWEFYAITATLFVTFSYPGFVYRYLLKHAA